jgi:2-keto-4-pentenoate hydratase/2-oxohepta-3-ene-1,7-dioic acid hydratase in catechol pathway
LKLITFTRRNDTVERAGLWLAGERVLDLAAAARSADERETLSSVLAILRGGDGARALLKRVSADARADAIVPASEVALLAPIPHLMRNVYCVGRNYLDHVKEGYQATGKELELPEVPQFFTKATHAMNAPNGDVRLDPGVTRRFDYEVELAVIIGRPGRDIAKERALEHVFGYAVANDFTARDLQRRHQQWFKGKSLDTTFPFGPWIVDAEEIGDPRSLELSLTVNGEERQRARVSQMIFDIPTLIASLAAGLTLEAGDIISTGTPAGVGFAMDPPRYLRGGDVVVSWIDRIGTLRNRIVEVPLRA